MKTNIAVVSLRSEDITLCANFYRDVIGLKPLPSPANMPHFDVGGIKLVILAGQPSTGNVTDKSDFPLIAISVDDFDQAVGRLQENGVNLPCGVEQAQDMRWVKFYDPGGNLIELVSLRNPAHE